MKQNLFQLNMKQLQMMQSTKKPYISNSNSNEQINSNPNQDLSEDVSKDMENIASNRNENCEKYETVVTNKPNFENAETSVNKSKGLNDDLINKINTISSMGKELKQHLTNKSLESWKKNQPSYSQSNPEFCISNITNNQLDCASKAVEKLKITNSEKN